MIVLATGSAAAVAFCAALFLLALQLLGRSIHGPPPSLIVYAIPFVAAAIAGRFTFVALRRFFARRP